MKKAWLPVALLLMARCLSGEQPDTGCPVAKPEPVPQELQHTFAADASGSFEDSRKELAKLMEGRRDAECANALRWYIYQLDKPIALREAAIKVLADWNIHWLFDDVNFLADSEVQSPEYRAVAVRMLGLIHRYYPALDKKTCEALFRKAGSDKPFLRDTALLALAEICSEYLWRANHPERLQTLLNHWRLAAKSASVESWPMLIGAAAAGELTELAPEVERCAADAKQALALRIEALKALCSLARPETLAVLDGLAKEENAALAEAIKQARPFALVACLTSTDAARRHAAFKELRAMGPAAEGALIKALEGEKDERQDLVKSILTEAVVAKFGLKPVPRDGLKRFGENAEKKQPGLDSLLIDKASKLILVRGEFVLEQGPLEYIVVGKGENAKLHETILAVHPSPTNLCLAMLLCAYEYVGEVRKNGKVNLPKGGGVMLSVEFERTIHTPEGQSKQTVRLPIEEFAWNNTTGRAMKRCPWAFTGSRWDTTEDGRKFLRAELEKSIAAIMVDPDAILNTPLDAAEEANVGGDRWGFYCINRRIIPARGTPCWLVLEPWSGDALTPTDLHDKGDLARAKPAADPKTEDGPPPVPKMTLPSVHEEHE